MLRKPVLLWTAAWLLFSLQIAQAALRLPSASGDWADIKWLATNQSPAPAPRPADDVYLSNNTAVIVSSGESGLRNLYIGDNAGCDWIADAAASAALLVKGGVLTVSGPKFQLGGVAGAKAVLSIDGGTLLHEVPGAPSRLETGLAPGTTSIIEVKSGRLQVDHLALSRAEGAQTALKVTGGDLELRGEHANWYLPMRVAGAKTVAYFDQTGGVVTLHKNRVLFIAGTGVDGDQMEGTARIVGGTFRGRIYVGGRPGTGTGTLVVGSAADIALAGPAKVGIELRPTGRIVFELGEKATFKSIDLRHALTNAVTFESPGATMLVDGTKFQATRKPKPIDLIVFKKGKGPPAASLGNLRVGYTGFSEKLRPGLVWTETSLQLVFR